MDNQMLSHEGKDHHGHKHEAMDDISMSDDLAMGKMQETAEAHESDLHDEEIMARSLWS